MPKMTNNFQNATDNFESDSQYLSTLANMFPINKRFSVIWKHKTRAISHAAPGVFPIMPVYRKLRNPRRVLRSHAPVPVWEANGRAISVYEHGHDRLGEMVNTG